MGDYWEDAAYNAVISALEDAAVDDLLGVVSFASDHHEHFGRECESYEKLSAYLEELYDEIYYAHAPFEGGEAIFEGDSQSVVGDILETTDYENFFISVRDPDDGSSILTSKELVEDSAESKILRLEFHDIGKELAEYFARHPEKLREIDPYAFEKLMAAVFKNRGFDVQLTPRSKDGGLDLALISRNDVGAAMTLVDCKRYAAHKKVGVEVVRGLYGVVEKKRATGGLIVTTSFFTSGAVAERDELRYRMELADYNKVQEYLKSWRR